MKTKLFAKIKKFFFGVKKPRFDVGDAVSNGSVTVFNVKEIIADKRGCYHYRVEGYDGLSYTYPEEFLDRVYATRFTG